MKFAVWKTCDFYGDPHYHTMRVEGIEEVSFFVEDAVLIDADTHGQALDRFIEGHPVHRDCAI